MEVRRTCLIICTTCTAILMVIVLGVSLSVDLSSKGSFYVSNTSK